MQQNWILETGRLGLRQMTEADLPALRAILQDEIAMYAYEHAFSEAEVQDWLAKQRTRYEHDGFGLWAVVLKQTGQMIGQCGLTWQDCKGESVLEVGYLFQRAHWHHGYATEAARGCMAYAFEKLGAEEVCSIIRDNNFSSQAVARRNGLRIRAAFTKHYYGVDMPHWVFAISRRQYFARKALYAAPFPIVHLPEAQWKGTVLPIGYTTGRYYDVAVAQTADGFSIQIQSQPAQPPITHTPEEYDNPDRLYQDHWTGAWAWGVVRHGRLAAAVETCPEVWSNRLRVTELWVDEPYRRQGLGHALLDVVREQARLERRRAVILETQSCNVRAVDFYLKEGFTLIGLDTCCYSNRDLERKEVRLEMGWFPARKARLQPEQVTVRPMTAADRRAVERMTQLAFWNKYRPGCDEHYIVHQLWDHPDFLPELSRAAVVDGQIVGAILYTRSWVQDGQLRRDTVTFGPLCVYPDWQGCGVGERLLRETLPLAAQAGYPGVIIFGEPDYYPRLGFRPCGQFGITTPQGETFDAFQCYELSPGAMAGVHGKFYESPAFEGLPPLGAEDLNLAFPPLVKQRFPGQWQV